MWNPFKRKNNSLGEIRDVVKIFTILEEFARRGLIYWKHEDQILLIEQSLASLKLSEGADGFRRFLNQVALWQSYKLMNEAYEQQRIDVEAEAVRNAQKKRGRLSKMDIFRIRQNARANMHEIGLDEFSQIREFDIMVIRASTPSAQDASEESGQLVAVGHYDGKQIEMAAYEDIEYLLKRKI